MKRQTGAPFHLDETIIRQGVARGRIERSLAMRAAFTALADAVRRLPGRARKAASAPRVREDRCAA